MLDADTLEKVFPTYLSAASKANLASALKQFPANRDYFDNEFVSDPNEPLQGDAWSTFTLRDFYSGESMDVSGIVLSNSCDIDQSNPSMRLRNVLFAPMITVESYAERLRAVAEKTSVVSHLEAVRAQQKTELFYIPESNRTPECVIQFDDIFGQPLPTFMAGADRRLVFRMNNYGFYLFLMKLSIHFTRFGEAIDRGMT